VLNVHVVCVLPVLHTPILSYYIILRNVCYKTDEFDSIYTFELTLSFEIKGVTLRHVQPTVLFKIHLSCSITLSVKESCR
jgi:hypothetical protein